MALCPTYVFEVYIGLTIWTWTPYPASSNKARNDICACFMHLGMLIYIVYIYICRYTLHYIRYTVNTYIILYYIILYYIILYAYKLMLIKKKKLYTTEKHLQISVSVCILVATVFRKYVRLLGHYAFRFVGFSFSPFWFRGKKLTHLSAWNPRAPNIPWLLPRNLVTITTELLVCVREKYMETPLNI